MAKTDEHEVIRDNLRRELLAFVGPVEVVFDYQPTRAARATIICDRVLKLGAPPARYSEHQRSFVLRNSVLQALVPRGVGYSAENLLACEVGLAGEVARQKGALRQLALHLARELADHGCACIRDELAMRGGPRPRASSSPAAYEHNIVVSKADLEAHAVAVPLTNPFAALADRYDIRDSLEYTRSHLGKWVDKIPKRDSAERRERIAQVNRYFVGGDDFLGGDD